MLNGLNWFGNQLHCSPSLLLFIPCPSRRFRLATQLGSAGLSKYEGKTNNNPYDYASVSTSGKNTSRANTSERHTTYQATAVAAICRQVRNKSAGQETCVMFDLCGIGYG
jgi:hypothetical protein